MFLVDGLEENYIHNAYTALLRKNANIPLLINKNNLGKNWRQLLPCEWISTSVYSFVILLIATLLTDKEFNFV